MAKRIVWTLLIANAALVAVLSVTAMPSLGGRHLPASMLRMHLIAGGVLAVMLPIQGLWLLPQIVAVAESNRLQRIGFWLLISCGLVTLTTLLVCMLPYPSTTQMLALARLHGYAGFAMVPAVLLVLVGAVRSQRIRATRSATPG